MDAIKRTAASLLSGTSDVLQNALASPARAEISSHHADSLNKDIQVTQILIHPIKSCKGTSVKQALYDHVGLKFDRTWLIIDAETRRFYTARELPKMVLIHPRIDEENNVLRIDIPTSESGVPGSTVETTLEPTQEWLDKCELIEDITIWVHKVNGYAVSKEADEKLSAYFGKPVRLVRKGPSPRPSGPTEIDGPKEWQETTVRYQDFFPCTVASAASLRNVQKTLAASVYPSLQSGSEKGADSDDKQQDGSADVQSFKVPAAVNREYWTPEELESLPITRFRPNIIVDTLPGTTGPELVPWEEDGWEAAEFFDGDKAGQDLPFGKEAEGKGRGIYLVAKCARCMVPNIDPETGVRDNFLPYRVLQQYRLVDPTNAQKGKPCFAMLSVPRETSGVIRVGDIMRITKTTDPSTRG